MRRWPAAALLLVASACSHSDTYTFTAPVVGPFSAGADVQLTFNVDQDYWPTWTQDGRGILYAYVDLESPSHRCVGLLPAAGGTRVWSLCDNRAVRRDSINSYSAFALDSIGQMLLVEAVTSPAINFPSHPQLFLVDTASPYHRTTLLTLPVTVGGVVVTWLSDVMWTGPNSFLALGQQFGTTTHCSYCLCRVCPNDSIFGRAGIVVSGLITGNQATLRGVDGTQGALGYAVIDGSASIAFVRRSDGELWKVPAAGGAPVAIATVTSDPVFTLLGVACRTDACVVAQAPVSTFGDFALLTDTASLLVTISLATGQVMGSQAYPHAIIATPQVSPVSGDLVLEEGAIVDTDGVGQTPVLGHLQTFASLNSQLHLLRAVLP